jgi:hypothetical protein
MDQGLGGAAWSQSLPSVSGLLNAQRNATIATINAPLESIHSRSDLLGDKREQGMPFATKFWAMMELPFPGDTVGGMTVEDVNVTHESVGPGQYAYAVQMVLRGVGGQQGVRRALRAILTSHPMTFSGYGNAYQLLFGTPEIESLGDQRYAVGIRGTGGRVYLEDELRRFLAYLVEEGLAGDGSAEEALVEAYMEAYQKEIKRKVGRFRSRLRRIEGGGA